MENWAIALVSAFIPIVIGLGIYLYYKWFHLFQISKYAENKSNGKNEKDKKIIEDKIGRMPEIENIKNAMIKMNKQFGSSRFALNAEYGAGKSFVVDKLEEMLNKDDNNICLNFKAWEKDEFYSPISRLIIEILEKEKRESFNLKFWQRRLLKRIVQYNNKKSISLYGQHTKKYEFLKETLGNIIKEGKKLYIFIDELDRAKPEDVIEFLEITNHFFKDNKDIILFYSYDLENMKKIISIKLGNVDSNNKYIQKFIDFEFKIFNRGFEYLKAIINDPKILNNIKNKINDKEINKIKENMSFLTNELLFKNIYNKKSLRDIEIDFKVILFMWNQTKDKNLAKFLIYHHLNNTYKKYKNKKENTNHEEQVKRVPYFPKQNFEPDDNKIIIKNILQISRVDFLNNDIIHYINFYEKTNNKNNELDPKSIDKLIIELFSKENTSALMINLDDSLVNYIQKEIQKEISSLKLLIKREKEEVSDKEKENSDTKIKKTIAPLLKEKIDKYIYIFKKFIILFEYYSFSDEKLINLEKINLLIGYLNDFFDITKNSEILKIEFFDDIDSLITLLHYIEVIEINKNYLYKDIKKILDDKFKVWIDFYKNTKKIKKSLNKERWLL